MIRCYEKHPTRNGSPKSINTSGSICGSSLATAPSKRIDIKPLARALDAALGCRCFWKKRVHFDQFQVCARSARNLPNHSRRTWIPSKYLSPKSIPDPVVTSTCHTNRKKNPPHTSFPDPLTIFILSIWIRRQLLLRQDLDQLLSVHGTEVLWWVGIPSRKPTVDGRYPKQPAGMYMEPCK